MAAAPADVRRGSRQVKNIKKAPLRDRPCRSFFVPEHFGAHGPLLEAIRLCHGIGGAQRGDDAHDMLEIADFHHNIIGVEIAFAV